jgi:hypothetical protein
MFAITLAVGLAVVAAVALLPFCAGGARFSRSSAPSGLALVGAALVLAVPTALWQVAILPSRNETFLIAFFLLLAGALLLMAGGEDDGEPGEEADEPPWWPSFELEFASYVRSRRRPVCTLPRR